MNGLLLKQARETKGLTQTAVAQAIGISQAYLAQLENGERGTKVPATLLTRLSEHLEIDFSALLKKAT